MSKFHTQIESLKGELWVPACNCTDSFLGGDLAHNIFTIHAQLACDKVTPMDVAAADDAPVHVTLTDATPVAVVPVERHHYWH